MADHNLGTVVPERLRPESTSHNMSYVYSVQPRARDAHCTQPHINQALVTQYWHYMAPVVGSRSHWTALRPLFLAVQDVQWMHAIWTLCAFHAEIIRALCRPLRFLWPASWGRRLLQGRCPLGLACPCLCNSTGLWCNCPAPCGLRLQFRGGLGAISLLRPSGLCGWSLSLRWSRWPLSSPMEDS